MGDIDHLGDPIDIDGPDYPTNLVDQWTWMGLMDLIDLIFVYFADIAHLKLCKIEEKKCLTKVRMGSCVV